MTVLDSPLDKFLQPWEICNHNALNNCGVVDAGSLGCHSSSSSSADENNLYWALFVFVPLPLLLVLDIGINAVDIVDILDGDVDDDVDDDDGVSVRKDDERHIEEEATRQSSVRRPCEKDDGLLLLFIFMVPKFSCLTSTAASYCTSSRLLY